MYNKKDRSKSKPGGLLKTNKSPTDKPEDSNTTDFEELSTSFTSALPTPIHLLSDRYTATSSDFLQETSCSAYDSAGAASRIGVFIDDCKGLDHVNTFNPVEFEDDMPELEPVLRPLSVVLKDEPLISAARDRQTAYERLNFEELNLNTVEHSKFANEFIQSIEYNADKLFNPPPPQFSKAALKSEDPTAVKQKDIPVEKGEEQEVKKKLQEVLSPFQDSLKLVYKKPSWPHQHLLSKRLDKLSALRNLMLDDSKLHSLRDLGSCLPNLTTLSVLRCSLLSLDGTTALPNLENLFAADNKITTPAPLAFLNKIRYVDLSGNPIASYDGFQYMSPCSYLRCMKLSDTEVSQLGNFHTYLKQLIPSIRDLHPKISIIHGKDMFSAEERATTDDTVDYFDELRGKSFYRFLSEANSSTTQVPSSSSFTDPISATLDAEIAAIYLNTKEKRLDKQLSQEMSAISEIMDLRDVEKRLREVYRPEKWNYRKRGASIIPCSIEEMDGLLENLDSLQKPPEN